MTKMTKINYVKFIGLLKGNWFSDFEWKVKIIVPLCRALKSIRVKEIVTHSCRLSEGQSWSKLPGSSTD